MFENSNFLFDETSFFCRQFFSIPLLFFQFSLLLLLFSFEFLSCGLLTGWTSTWSTVATLVSCICSFENFEFFFTGLLTLFFLGLLALLLSCCLFRFSLLIVFFHLGFVSRFLISRSADKAHLPFLEICLCMN